jgi:aspartyl-tRNA synthetase
MYRTHNCGELNKKHTGEKVTLSGWVHRRRDLGGLIFIDLRDRYGLTQVIFDPNELGNFDIAEKLKYEFVVRVEGEVVKRDDKTINKDNPTGEIELRASSLEIISESAPLPFEIFESHKGEEDEELRLKYRYLELRREKLRDNILFRAKMIKYLRDYMDNLGYTEIATPILTVSSPEGARDFLVPSRIHPGKFYALPQAPQQYKQLLMVAGFDKYYQVAPCMRDEDPRADRSPGEFYQLDVETSFKTPDEFFAEMEPLFIGLTEKVAEKQVQSVPFPRITYKEAMEKYGSDRPDLRFGIELEDVTEWAGTTDFNVFKNADFVRALRVPEGAKFTRKEIDEDFTRVSESAHAKGLAWIKFQGGEFSGSIVKFFNKENLTGLMQLLDIKDGDIIFFVADCWEVSCTALGEVRNLVGDKMELKDPNVIAWAWIVDFPMYEKNKVTGKIDFAHNPFSMPRGGMEALEKQAPLDIIGEQYDIIANGLELSSGAMRNTIPAVMYKAFAIAGYKKSDVDKKFSHMIEAFGFGAPPHLGFAPGIDRLAMLLLGEKNIRAVVPFPKNQKAQEPMMGSPAEVSVEQLKELGLSLDKK